MVENDCIINAYVMQLLMHMLQYAVINAYVMQFSGLICDLHTSGFILIQYLLYTK